MRKLHRAVLFLQCRMMWFMLKWIRPKMGNGGIVSETEWRKVRRKWTETEI